MKKIALFAFVFFLAATSCAFSDEIEKEPSSSQGVFSWLRRHMDGQIRLRGDFVRNQSLTDFSYTPGQNEGQLFERTRLGGWINPLDWIKLYGQAQWYARWSNHNSPSEFMCYQGYLQVDKPFNWPLQVKLGRQELSYGDIFFLGPNDFYEGIVWDAARVRWEPNKKYWMDLIAGRLVNVLHEFRPAHDQLYGVYSSFHPKEEFTLENYFFYSKGGFQFWHPDLSTDQNWFSVGTRVAGKFLGFEYQVEPVYQFGRMKNLERDGHDKVSTYGGHAQVSRTFKIVTTPQVFADFAYGRGDAKNDDSVFHEFHGSTYNDWLITGDINVITDLSGVDVNDVRASGMKVWTGGFVSQLHPRLCLNFDYHYFYADQVPSGYSKHIGQEFDLFATYQVCKNFQLEVGVDTFLTGSFFSEASGPQKRIDYLYIQSQFDF